MSTKVEIDTDVFKTIEGLAKDRNTTEKKIINEMIKKEIEKDNIPDFLQMGGMFTTDEPFDAVEDRKKMTNGEL